MKMMIFEQTYLNIFFYEDDDYEELDDEELEDILNKMGLEMKRG